MSWEPPFTKHVEETYRRLRTGARLQFEKVGLQRFGERHQTDDAWDFTITIDNAAFYTSLGMPYEPRRTPQHATVSFVVSRHEDTSRYHFSVTAFPGFPPLNWEAPYRHRRKLWHADLARYAGALAYAIDLAFIPEETYQSELYGVLRWVKPYPLPLPHSTHSRLPTSEARAIRFRALVDRLEEALSSGSCQDLPRQN